MAVFAEGPGLQGPALIASNILPTNNQAESLSPPSVDGHSPISCVGASSLNVIPHSSHQMGQPLHDAASSRSCPGVGVINVDVNVEHPADVSEEGILLTPEVAGVGPIDVIARC